MKLYWTAVFILFTFLFSCNSGELGENEAELIIYNAIIWTGDSTNPHASVMALRGNKILYVGESRDSLSGQNTKMMDAAGKFITPGFIDNHVHFLSGGYQLTSVNLREAKTKADFISTFADFAKTGSATEWIAGGDWDHEAMGEMPARQWIDSVSNGRPVMVSRYDGHMALANTRALELAGISRNTKDPDGGQILRDENGEPTGILKDAAMDMVSRTMPDHDTAALDKMLVRAQEHALSLGITQVADVNSYGGWTDLETYRRHHEKNLLKLRIYSMVPISGWEKMQEYIEKNGRGDDMLFWGGLKGFVDGSLGSTTAWFYQPYLDEPGSTGLVVSDLPELRKDILAANQAGLQVAIHAIGDRAIDWLLDVFEAAGTEGKGRFRIEHNQHVSEAAIPRYNPLGVIASMQPYHAIDDGRWASKRLDSVRLSRTYAFETLRKAGTLVTFGSDWTVAPLNPMEGLYAAVSRQTLDDQNPRGWFPMEIMLPEDVLTCYTVNNAYANFMETKTGMLKAGMLADFVTWDRNLLESTPAEMRAAKALQTYVNGKLVYEASQ